MQLLFLLFLLIAPFLILTPLERFVPSLKVGTTTRAKAGLTIFFIFTAIGHFVRTKEMSLMVPPVIPYPVETIYITGVLELLGAIGIWIPSLKKITGFSLILMLIGILPANIYSAIYHIDFGGHETGPAYLLVRIPFQLFVICWVYFATEQNWFQKQST
jgi:uncharacterized membrane protein